MLIDITFGILMILAVYKGFSKGFIVALFSVLGFIIGIAAALKLSAIVAAKLSTQIDGGSKWLPAVSFLLVFIAAAFLVNFIGRIIQRTFETIMLGWLNRIAGILLYAILYSMILSVFLFYAVQLNFIKPQTISESAVYPYLQPIAPKVINGFGSVIPWFKNMFEQLQQFFGGVAAKA
jgi:membrane protein required for colicin V production